MRIDAAAGVYRGRKVLLTGHTGFKGSWLAEWLIGLGAEVTGYSLPPPTEPSLFAQLGLAQRLHHREGDVRDAAGLGDLVQGLQPDFVFHLAAQPLVRLSYAEPVETYAVNVMGTINVMEALRGLRKPCAAVMITTDKCYENREWLHGYREDDALGGYDPYSSSKAAAEIAIASYRRSFFNPKALCRGDSEVPPVALASARAGNVIGGGDWALDRIVPDCMRALARGEALAVRNPAATRPWQHVLEPLGGYLTLGAALHAALLERGATLETLAGPFNFGPDVDSNRPVRDLVGEMLQHWPGRWEDKSDARALHEAGRLHLTTEKAYHLLGWRPRWRFAETIARTTRWYRGAHEDPASVPALTRADLAAYVAARP